MKSTSAETPVTRRRKFWAMIRDFQIVLVFLLGLAGLLLSTLGFHKYYQAAGQPFTLADCFFQAVQLLSLNSGAVPPTAVLADGSLKAVSVPWMLQVGRILTPLVTFYTIIKILLAVFRDSWHLIRIRFFNQHRIICGLGRKGLLLAREWRENDVPVVIIERDMYNIHLSEARALGCKVVFGDARDELMLEKAGLNRASHLVVVCGEDKINAEVAARARWLLKGRRGTPLTATIHIEDSRLWVLLRELEFTLAENDPLRLEFFNVFENGAYVLAERYFMPAHLTGEPTILVVGLGGLGESLVVNIARNWAAHFKQTGQKIKILAMDARASQACAALQVRFPLVQEVVDLQALEMDLQSAQFHGGEYLQDECGVCTISHAVVTLEDDAAGMNVGLSLLQHIRNPLVKVIVTQWEDIGFAYLMQKSDLATPQVAGITVFGLLNHTCRERLLDDGTHERLARAIHRVYRRTFTLGAGENQAGSAHVEWEELAPDYRAANRGQADDIGRKLAIIGYRIRPWVALAGMEAAIEEEDVKYLGRVEHDRWMREKIAQGWRYGPQRNNDLKLHPDLLDWEDPRFTSLAREKDFNTVRNIPAYLLEAGFQIEKINR